MVEIVPQFFRTSEESPLKRLLGRMDWSLLGAAVILSVAGMAFVHSATSTGSHGGAFVMRQGVALVAGLAGMAFLTLLPYQIFQTYARPVYLGGLLLLVGVLLLGTRLRGSRSWFHLGMIYFQPVELARLATAVGLAALVELKTRDMEDWRALLTPLILAAAPMGLILLQPDLSSALSLGPMTIAVLFVGGAPVTALAVIIGTAAIALGIPLASTYFTLVRPEAGEGAVLHFIRRAFTERTPFLELLSSVVLLTTLGWWLLRRFRVAVPGAVLAVVLGVLGSGVAGSFVVEKAIKSYQRKRLIAFVDPAVDPLGAGYNILQSKIAIGSGRVLGKGYLSGSQSQLGFLPEKHTDFIFAIIGEELGFIGSLAILGVYFWVVFRALDIAAGARDRFGCYLATAIAAHFAFTGLVNAGMVMGLMPVTGLPLPFLSYGGSGLVGSFLAVGLLLSIHLRRYIL